MSELEARVRRLEDLEEIRQLFVDYGRALDAGDFETYASLFSTDGELKLGPVARATGRDEIRTTMTKALDGMVGTSFHVISSPVIHLAGDTATAEVMWTAIAAGEDGGPRLTMIGKHVDRLVREKGRWRIRERRGLIDLPSAYRKP